MVRADARPYVGRIVIDERKNLMSSKLDFSKELIGRRALVVALLASDRGKWMTGGNIQVDGGMTAR